MLRLSLYDSFLYERRWCQSKCKKKKSLKLSKIGLTFTIQQIYKFWVNTLLLLFSSIRLFTVWFFRKWCTLYFHNHQWKWEARNFTCLLKNYRVKINIYFQFHINGGILLYPTCKINYVNIKHNYMLTCNLCWHVTYSKLHVNLISCMIT